MERVMDISDATELRQAAVGVLISWQPDEGFWQQMAVLTWREPSRQMSAFIASTIYGVSQFNNPRFIQQYVYVL